VDEEAYKSFRNLPDVQILLDGELNAYDILCNDWVVFTTETLPGGSDLEQAVELKAAPAAAAKSAVSEPPDAVPAEPDVPTAAAEPTEESSDD
jgi:large subunit ribosomal protein L4